MANTNIGSRIKKIRKSKRISQEKLSKLTKIFKQSQICRIENNTRKLTIEDIRVLANALKCNISDLL